MNGASDERRVRTSYDKTESPDQRWPACCIRAARSSQRIEERDLPAVAGGGVIDGEAQAGVQEESLAHV